MKNLSITVIFMIAALTACAKRPDAIAPAVLPQEAYMHQNCRALFAGLNKERGNLAILEKKQNKAATGDSIGVFLVAVPTSSLFGKDKAGDVSLAKGKIAAIEAAIKRKYCK